METKLNVDGFISRVIPAQLGIIPKEQVQIGFVLNDSLKIQGRHRPMSQHCYEQTIISVDLSQVLNDSDDIIEMVYDALYGDMHMNPYVEAHIERGSEETLCSRIVEEIKVLVEATRHNYGSFETVSLQFHVDASVKMSGQLPPDPSGGPIGEHSYARLQQRRFNEVCGICQLRFLAPVRIVVPPCHHPLHKSCYEQMEDSSCPVCSFHLGPMAGGQLPFDDEDDDDDA